MRGSPRFSWISALAATLGVAVGCGGGSARPAGAVSTGGTGGAGGAGGSGGKAPSGLPEPATTGVPQPSGAPGGFTALDWAGFSAAVSWTFDDSQPSQIAHYAELAAVGIPMTFYITIANAPSTTTTRRGRRRSRTATRSATTRCTTATPISPAAARGPPTPRSSRRSTTAQLHHPALPGPGARLDGRLAYGDTGYDADDMTRFLVNRGVGSGLVGTGPYDFTDPFDLPIYLAQPDGHGGELLRADR